ncbi:MAG TPA: serine/threonine-protein kinase [Mycobacteriales bacterium]|nr:serine/threonine-protein kinase [Mycobacteriales bacterium]
MPLHGEGARKTYVGHREIANSVWVARHEILGENCIQKTYAPAGREDAIAFAEPRLLNDLDHPHITPLREAQFDPHRSGHVTLVMPVYEGGSIHDAISADGHRFSIGEAVTILQDIAGALAYLHVTKGYVHRDLKPKNVLLDLARQRGYLADFGSAARLDATTSTAQAVRTTALYQAPEAAATGRVGMEADIYALGLTAFEMLNGLFPYEELDAADVDRRINAGRRSLPDRLLAPAAFAPHVPDQLRRLIRSMIDARPAARPTAMQLLRQLRALKCVDWRHADGPGLDGSWRGGWPPRQRPERQTELLVTSRLLAAGRDRGKRRVEARYRTATSGGWRTVGVGPSTCGRQDAAAVSAFFSAVDAHVAKRWPA